MTHVGARMFAYNDEKIFLEGTRQPWLGAVPPVSAAQPVDTVRALCHDMRQRLLTLQLLAGDLAGSDHVAPAVLKEVEWLAALVESVLGPTSDSGPSDVDLGELVREVASVAFARSTCRHSVHVRTEVWLRVRRTALKRALICLVDNAMRAAGPDGTVALEVTERDGQGRITISDDGPGLGRIAPQDSLGLPITRAVLADHG